MDARDAIARIQDHNRVHQQKEHGAFYITEALNMAVDALEKQIPKKPKGNVWGYTCPTCGEKQIDNAEDVNLCYPHCFNCGQRLDWGTIDENI